MKKIIATALALTMSLALALPVCAASNSIQTAGGEGTSAVKLTVAAATFNVTVPTELPLTVTANGSVTAADNVFITNNSHGKVRVKNVEVTGVGEWTVVPFGDLSGEAVNAKKIGMKINDDVTENGGFFLNPEHWPDIAAGGSLPITYTAALPAQSEASTGTTIANVVFTVGWAN